MFGRQVGIANNICTWNLGIVLVFGAVTALPVRGQCEQAKLTASDAAQQDIFGRSVDISGDYLVVGAPSIDIANDPPGAAYVFRRQNFDWIEVQKLTASDAAPIDEFGHSVSISGDVIAVGAWRAPEGGIQPGAVYVFRRAGETWLEEAKPIPADAADGDVFGLSVSLDGNYLAVGAPRHDQPVTSAGAVYIYWFDGANWVQQDKLAASDVASSTGLGSAVSLYADLVVATSFVKNAAYAFRRNGTSWSEEAKLIPSDLAPEDEIVDVAVRGDEIIVGYFQPFPHPLARGSADETSGAAHVFRYFAGSWVQAGTLVPGVATPYACFGCAIDIGEAHLVVGAPGFQLAAGDEPGAAYLFQRIGMLWTAQVRITSSDGGHRDAFGVSCAIDGTHVLVGASGNDDACPENLLCNSGSAYVYWLETSSACEEIPAVSQWGLVIMILGLLVVATLLIGARRGRSMRASTLVAFGVILCAYRPVQGELNPRRPHPKPDRIARPAYPSHLQVKFRDDLMVRAANGDLTSLVGGDLSDPMNVRDTFALTFEQLIVLPQEKIDFIETRAARLSGFAQPDLAGMMSVAGTDATLEDAANALLVLDEIEWVDFMHVVVPAVRTAASALCGAVDGLGVQRDPLRRQPGDVTKGQVGAATWHGDAVARAGLAVKGGCQAIAGNQPADSGGRF